VLEVGKGQCLYKPDEVVDIDFKKVHEAVGVCW